jgi:shikimate 5-dehydrogenase
LIYHPEETVFLRHGRETGHQIMNGKNMIVCQAVIAFCKICRPHLKSLDKDTQATQREIAGVMFANW